MTTPDIASSTGIPTHFTDFVLQYLDMHRLLQFRDRLTAIVLKYNVIMVLPGQIFQLQELRLLSKLHPDPTSRISEEVHLYKNL